MNRFAVVDFTHSDRAGQVQDPHQGSPFSLKNRFSDREQPLRGAETPAMAAAARPRMVK